MISIVNLHQIISTVPRGVEQRPQRAEKLTFRSKYAIYPVYLKSCDITGQHLQYLRSCKLVYKTDERYHALKTFSCKQLNFNTLMVRSYSKHKSSNTTSDLLLSNAWYCTNLYFVKNENAIMPFSFKKIVFVLKVFCSK